MPASFRNPQMALVVLLLISLAFLLGSSMAACSTMIPPAGNTARYDFLHVTAGSCLARDKEGQEVIDMRNGIVWRVPYDGSAPIYETTLNLAGIPENASAAPQACGDVRGTRSSAAGRSMKAAGCSQSERPADASEKLMTNGPAEPCSTDPSFPRNRKSTLIIRGTSPILASPHRPPRRIPGRVERTESPR